MKKLTFSKDQIKPSLLLDEIIAAGIAPSAVRVEHNEKSVYITIQSDKDEAIIAGLVESHDHTKLNMAENRALVAEATLADILDRYSDFEGKSFLEIVAAVDQWAAGVRTRVDAWPVDVPQDVKGEIKDMATKMAEFIGPVIAFVYIQQSQKRE